MNNWQTYRNGNTREIWNLERLARHRAAKLGYRVQRSRRRKGRDNAGEFMLIHKASSTVLVGAGYTANLETILSFMEGERMHGSWVIVRTKAAEQAARQHMEKKVKKAKDQWEKKLWHLSKQEFACQHDAEVALSNLFFLSVNCGMWAA